MELHQEQSHNQSEHHERKPGEQVVTSERLLNHEDPLHPIPPGTYGTLKRKGSMHDYVVSFEWQGKTLNLEVNEEELEP